MVKTDRAKRIAGSFPRSVSLKVIQFRKGLLVRYGQETCYFSREPCFWNYIFTLAGVPVALANYRVDEIS